MAFTARVRPERLADYLTLHATPWPDYLALIKQAKLQNFTIHVDRASHVLFMRFSYQGDDLDRDLAWLDAQPVARAWDAATSPCLAAREGATDAWVPLEEAFVWGVS